MGFSWRTRRQLFFFSIFAAIVLLLVGAFIYFFRPAPSCFDKKQNQHEESVDCGGECEACVGKPQAVIQHWVRFFEVAPGIYEVGAYIENPNLLLGAPSLEYQVRLYDSNNILIALKAGLTFLNPRESFLIYVPDIRTLKRIPARATIEFNQISWKRLEAERPRLLVTNLSFSNDPWGRLAAVLENQSLFSVNNINLTAIIYDSSGNALGISSSALPSVAGERKANLFFTWREAFEPPPSSFEIIARVNLFEK